MSRSGRRLGEIDDELPRLFVARRNINCSWEHKGKVMRRIMHDTDGRRRDLVDGVKVYYEGGDNAVSALLIPDKERPLFHINVEAHDLESAEAVANDFETKIIRWRDEP
jgi:mannose-1-phosphate guanylyltransferase/phosphomannomutase